MFDLAPDQGWQLLASRYVVREIEKNVEQRLSLAAGLEWRTLRPKLSITVDVLTFPWPAVFSAAKDRPVLFTAVAESDLLLTLDRADFSGLMTSGFYGLPIMTPGNFLRRERDAGRLGGAV